MTHAPRVEHCCESSSNKKSEVKQFKGFEEDVLGDIEDMMTKQLDEAIVYLKKLSSRKDTLIDSLLEKNKNLKKIVAAKEKELKELRENQCNENKQ